MLLTAGIGITARGDASDTSIDELRLRRHLGQQRVVGPRATTFYNKTRGSDFINLALVKTIRKRLGKTNVTRKGIDAVLNDMTAINVQIQSLAGSRHPRLPGRVHRRQQHGGGPARRASSRVFDNAEIPAPICQITIDRGLDADAVHDACSEQLASDGTSSTAS